MKLPKSLSGQGPQNKNAMRGGAYSLVITAVVLAILIVVNILFSALPTRFTKYDISSSKLYSITSNTKVVVNALEEDVTIYWIVQSDQEDAVIENLLDKYDALSDHISVVKKNPDVFPDFAAQYTDEDVKNNSLVVECGDKSRFISYDDIYLQSEDLSSYYSTSPDSFDGEGAITSAIDYVVSDTQPQLYLLEGHGEAELPSSFADQVEKENIETQSLSLLTVDAVPEDAACVMIYSPATDISQEEAEMLSDYVSGGGKLLVCSGLTESGVLENLYSILSDYGIETADGVVVEGDREHYVQYPYLLLPNLESSTITDSLIEDRYYAVIPTAVGMRVTGSTGGAQVTELLTTSDAAFSKAAGYEITTYEKEDGDTDGPFALGVSIECSDGGGIVWFSSASFLEDAYNAFSSGANVNMTMNALSSLVGESEAMAIRSKSLNYNYLTISDSTSALLKVVMIGVFPLVFLCAGIWVVIRRRNLQNEAV